MLFRTIRGTATLIDYRKEATGDTVTTIPWQQHNKALETIVGLKGARHRLDKVDRKPEEQLKKIATESHDRGPSIYTGNRLVHAARFQDQNMY